MWLGFVALAKHRWQTGLLDQIKRIITSSGVLQQCRHHDQSSTAHGARVLVC